MGLGRRKEYYILYGTSFRSASHSDFFFHPLSFRFQKNVKLAEEKIKQQSSVISEQCITLNQYGFKRTLNPPQATTTDDSRPASRQADPHTCITLFESPPAESGVELGVTAAPLLPDASSHASKHGHEDYRPPAAPGSDRSQHRPEDYRPPAAPGSDRSKHRLEDFRPPAAPGSHCSDRSRPPDSEKSRPVDKHTTTSSKHETSTGASTTSGSVGIASPRISPEVALPPPPPPPHGTKGPRHVLYTHTHNTNTVAETPAAVRVKTGVSNGATTSAVDHSNERSNGHASADSVVVDLTSSSGVAEKSLSLKRESVTNKIRYRTVSRPADIPIHSEEETNLGRNSSSPISPSLLTTASRSSVAMPTDHDEAPLSCSMFATLPPDRTETTPLSETSEPVNHTPSRVSPRKSLRLSSKRKRLNEIAVNLRSGGSTPKSRAASTLEESLVDVVPVTPGVKSVEKIHVDDMWLVSDPQGTGAQNDGEGGTASKDKGVLPSSSPSPAVRGDGETKKLASKLGNGAFKYQKRSYDRQCVENVAGSRKRQHSDDSGARQGRKAVRTTAQDTGSGQTARPDIDINRYSYTPSGPSFIERLSSFRGCFL